MTVSNEDRASAAATVNAALQATYESMSGHLAVDALIAHGWGPRPRLNAHVLNNWITAVMVDPTEMGSLVQHLEEKGIEVVE